ncbi:MAG: hypothetical protein HC852_11835 [Acaryochloridaceae cyanobacterium RU_4_10]|nr:hypothetical protein [Acaryochloridaceae cyanobacterium RU_4_10]
MKKKFLFFLIIVPGIGGIVVFGSSALQDWGQLQEVYSNYKKVAATSSDLSILFKANASQMIQRINLFADGTWTLLSAILAGIGLHGFLTSD